MNRRTLSCTLVVLALLCLPVQAFACACCSGEADYYLGFRKPTSYQLDLIRDMKFADKANLVTSEAGPELDARGISQPSESYSLTGSFSSQGWKLIFREGDRTGSLTLPLPARMVSYSADIHDGQTSGGGGPLLYKEWRFEGPVTGTGVFRNGITPQTKYFLVLQGRGNSCDNAADFKHWRVEVNGKKARFAFYGHLSE